MNLRRGAQNPPEPHSTELEAQTAQGTDGAAVSLEEAEAAARECTTKMTWDMALLGVEGVAYTTAIVLLILQFPSLDLLWVLCAYWAMVSIARRNGRRFAGTAKRLIATGHCEAAGPLAQWLGTSPDSTMRTASVTAMVRLLPHLDETDARLFTPKQRAYLRSLLLAEPQEYPHISYEAQGNSDLRMKLKEAILDAFKRIGDKDDVPYVERLAASVSDAPQEVNLREAAWECLAVMRARLAAGAGSNTLLRPASAADVGEAELLRGAEASPQSPPELLLRPAGGVDAATILSHWQAAVPIAETDEKYEQKSGLSG